MDVFWTCFGEDFRLQGWCGGFGEFPREFDVSGGSGGTQATDGYYTFSIIFAVSCWETKRDDHRLVI